MTSKDCSVSIDRLAERGEDLPPIMPQWCFRASGREFVKYAIIARKKPRRSVFGLPVMSPLCRFAIFWGFVNAITDLTYTAFVVALSLAFNGNNLDNVYTILDIIGSFIYITDLLLQFHIGYVIALLAAHGGNRHGTQALLLLKLLRLLRVVHLMNRMGHADAGGYFYSLVAVRMTATTVFVVHTVLSLCILVNLMTCVWWWIATLEGLDHSWVALMNKPEIDLYTSSDGTRWLVSSYFVLTTIATVGYGDITAATGVEVFLAMLFIIVGVAYFGFLITRLSALLEASNAKAARGMNLLQKMQEMEAWMARNAFPAHLRKELRKFYFTSWAPEPDNDAEFFDELPTWLRIKTSADLLSTSPLLGGMLSEGSDKILTREQREVVLRILAAFSLPTHLSPTHVLCKPGDQAQHVYLLEEGELLMLVPGLREPTVVSAPAIVGLGALLASDVEQCRTRSTTLIAATSCMVWKVDAGGMRRQLNNKVPEALLYFMRQFASQLRNMLAHANAQPLKPPALQALIARCEASLAALAELEPLQVQQVENFKKMAEESAAAGKYSRTSMALSSSLSVSQIDEENQTHVEEVLERRHEIVQEAREKAQEGEQGVAAKQGDVAFLM